MNDQNQHRYKIEAILQNIQERLENIENQLELLNHDIRDNVTPGTKKMSNHIDFIEQVYNKIKSPMQFLCYKMSSRKAPPLPDPTHSQISK